MTKLRALTFFAALCFALATNAQKKDFQLVWSDEFNYTGLPDSTKWNYDIGGHGWGNDELEYYTNARKENARVENGKLIIEARKENFKNMNYTSARLVTKGKGDWLYGRIEVRAKLPTGKGTWPAIWMLSSDWTYGAWPESGEIDIMEHVGYDQDNLHFSIHCLDYYFKINTQKTATMKIKRADTTFYNYALEWYPDRLEGYINDSLYFTFKNEHLGWRKWPFDKPFHLIMNLAVGGGWGGAMGVDTTIWPQKMEVDYVRVYQPKNMVDTEAPKPVEKSEFQAHSNRIDLYWQPTYDNYGVKDYTILCNNKVVGTTVEHSFKIINIEPSTTYNIQIVANDWKGNKSKPFEQKIATLKETSYALPGKVEAEDYVKEIGTRIETTNDSLGGYDLCWIEPGDKIEFSVNVTKKGNYTFSLRAATERKDGVVEIYNNDVKIGTVAITNTGSWQKWRLFSSASIPMEAGTQKLTFKIVGDRISLNWFDVK